MGDTPDGLPVSAPAARFVVAAALVLGLFAEEPPPFWQARFLRAQPIDPVRAQQFAQSLMVPGEILVEIVGITYHERYATEDLQEYTYLRFRTGGRDFCGPLASYVPPERSPTRLALFRFERPDGLRPDGTVEFVTEFRWARRFRFGRERYRVKARFSLDQMCFEDRLTL